MTLRLTPGQLTYLEELIADDLEETELTHEETEQASAALVKVREALYTVVQS